MTHLTPTAEAALPPPRALSVTALLTEGFGEIAARWPQALALWALGAGVRAVPRLFRTAERVAHVGWLPADAVRMALTAAVTAVLAALALRLFLVRGPGWWRPDRGFWICAALLMAASLGSSAISVLGLRHVAHVADLRPAGLAAMRAGLAAMEVRQGEVFALQAVLAWIYVRLMLWPIGALMGEAAVTPARSWALMRGQVAGFIVAVIILGAPLFLATIGATLIDITVLHQPPTSHRLWIGIASAVLGPAAGLVQHAMTAVIWRAKTGLSADPGVP